MHLKLSYILYFEVMTGANLPHVRIAAWSAPGSVSRLTPQGIMLQLTTLCPLHLPCMKPHPLV